MNAVISYSDENYNFDINGGCGDSNEGNKKTNFDKDGGI